MEFSLLEIFGFPKLEIDRIFQIGNFWITQIRNGSNFPNWKFLEFYKLQVFGIFLIENFSNVQNCLIFQIFRMFQSDNFWNFPY